jgi:hypothetical protein
MNDINNHSTKRALLVGIDKYAYLGILADLEGCVNDVRLMAGILKDNFGFLERDITVLTDERATRDQILKAMDELTESTVQNDIVVIHYSGHGSQIRDRENDEPDGWDETIVPHDSGRGTHENREISDDEIYVRLSRLNAITPYVTLIFDCCHSGSITRDAFGAKKRWIEPDQRPVEELPPSPLSPDEALLLQATARDIGPSDWFPTGQRYTLIAGCRDGESSFEHSVNLEGSVVKHGALTYFLAQELVKADKSTTYRDVYERASAQVTAAHSHQHPQMEGARDRVLFGVSDIEPMRFVTISKRTGDQITLNAGAAHGMSVGSIWSVYPQTTKSVTDDTPKLGTVKIISVGAISADARIEQEEMTGAISTNCRAVEQDHFFGEMLLVVEINTPAGFEGAVTRLGDLINESRLLHRSGEGEIAEVRVYVIPARMETNEGDPVPQLPALEEPTWAVVEDGELIFPPRPVSDSGAIRKIVNDLEKKARYRNALAVINPNPDSILKSKIDFVLKRQKPDGTWESVSADETNVFEVDERIAIEITNRHTAPVYISVLDFGLTYGISLIHPPNRPGDKFNPLETPVKIGERSEEAIELWIPETFQQDEGTETFKLFASLQETDFSWLQQEGVRSVEEFESSKGFNTPLGALFEMAYTGVGLRDARPTRVPQEEEWTTVERRFILRKKSPSQ